jgi:hypothetical protein
MATANKQDIQLRIRSNAPLNTIGSELTWQELDDNFITTYNQFVALSNSSNVDAYSASVTYVTNDYVTYNNQLYKMISASPQINITPDSDPAIWSEVYASDLVQAPNGVKKVTKLIEAADVLNLQSTPVELIEALGANQVAIIQEITATAKFDSVSSPTSTAYAGGTTVYVAPTTTDVAGGETPTATMDQILASTTQKTVQATMNTIAFDATKDFVPANTAYNIFTLAAPTTGDFDLLITCTYRIIDIS